MLLAFLVTTSFSAGCVPKELAPELTRAAFEAIPNGSTTEEVRRKLGAPFATLRGVFDDPNEQQWWYGKVATVDGTEYSFPKLTFVDGKLRSRAWDETALDPQRVWEIVPGVTRAAFEKVPEGSTTEEVRAKLGPPFKEVLTVSGDLSKQLHWCYGKRASATGTAYSFPMLTFVNGKLESRLWSEAARYARQVREIKETGAAAQR
jgi:hypothetical protein